MGGLLFYVVNADENDIMLWYNIPIEDLKSSGRLYRW